MVRTTGLVYGANQDLLIKNKAVPYSTGCILHVIIIFLFLDLPFWHPFFSFFFFLFSLSLSLSSLLPNKKCSPNNFFPFSIGLLHLCSNLFFLLPLLTESWLSVVLQIWLPYILFNIASSASHCRFCLPEISQYLKGPLQLSVAVWLFLMQLPFNYLRNATIPHGAIHHIQQLLMSCPSIFHTLFRELNLRPTSMLLSFSCNLDFLIPKSVQHYFHSLQEEPTLDNMSQFSLVLTYINN